MPNRILRDWTDSERVDLLSVEGERFFVRLIMKADDYGRYFADPKRLKSYLFPLKDSLRDTDISRWLAECEKAGLIACYDATGKRFCRILGFNQRLRQMKKVHPAPPEGEPFVNGSDPPPIDRQWRAGGHSPSDSPSASDSSPEGDARGNQSDGNIPTFDEVFEYGKLHGVTPTTCRRFFNHHEGKNLWLNRNGFLIRWKFELGVWRDKDRDMPRDGVGKVKDKSLLQKEIEEMTVDDVL